MTKISRWYGVFLMILAIIITVHSVPVKDNDIDGRGGDDMDTPTSWHPVFPHVMKWLPSKSLHAVAVASKDSRSPAVNELEYRHNQLLNCNKHVRTTLMKQVFHGRYHPATLSADIDNKCIRDIERFAGLYASSSRNIRISLQMSNGKVVKGFVDAMRSLGRRAFASVLVEFDSEEDTKAQLETLRYLVDYSSWIKHLSVPFEGFSVLDILHVLHHNFHDADNIESLDLKFRDQNLGEAEFSMMTRILSSLKGLKAFNLVTEYATLDHNGLIQLSKAWKNLRHLKLNLFPDVVLDPETITELSDSLRSMNQLESFAFEYDVEDQDMSYFYNTLSQMNIQRLNIAIYSKHAAFCKTVLQNAKIQSLIMEYYSNDLDDAEECATALNENVSLKKLRLKLTRVENAEVLKTLSMAVRDHSSLTEVSIFVDWNHKVHEKFHPEQSLSMIFQNPGIKSLEIDTSHVGILFIAPELAGSYLGSALAETTTLESFVFKGSISFSKEGLTKLAAGIAKNKSLKSLSLELHIQQEDYSKAESVLEAVKENSGLRHVDISYRTRPGIPEEILDKYESYREANPLKFTYS